MQKTACQNYNDFGELCSMQFSLFQVCTSACTLPHKVLCRHILFAFIVDFLLHFITVSHQQIQCQGFVLRPERTKLSRWERGSGAGWEWDDWKFGGWCCFPPAVRQSQTVRSSCRVLVSWRGSTPSEGTEALIVRQETPARHCLMQKWQNCQNQRTFSEPAWCNLWLREYKHEGWKKTAADSRKRQIVKKETEKQGDTLEYNFA